MKYLVALMCLLACSVFGHDLSASRDLVLFGSQSIAAGQTNVVETTVQITGVGIGAIVYATGSSATTTTVASVRNDTARTMATIGANNTVVQSNITHNIYSEYIRFTTINYGTNAVTVSPAIIYEK